MYGEDDNALVPLTIQYHAVRKKFPTVEYFFYGDTRSTNSSTCTTLLCYGSGIQRTAQYVSTLTTRTSVAMITWREMYDILSKLLLLVFT